MSHLLLQRNHKNKENLKWKKTTEDYGGNLEEIKAEF